MSSDRFDSQDFAVDAEGRRTLVGLTFEETAEFERLDASLPFDGLHVWPDLSGRVPLLPMEARWRELWLKHQTAKAERSRRPA